MANRPYIRKTVCLWLSLMPIIFLGGAAAIQKDLGREVAIPRHMQDGEEYKVSIPALIDYGRTLFDAMWTSQEGAGRPLTKGTGAPLANPHEPLVFPRNFNRVSGPDTNSCSGCHNKPYIGGGGDIAANVFVLGQRFDFATFNQTNLAGTQTAADEIGNPATLQTIANFRKTIGMSGSGFIEMLARQITSDLQAIRDSTVPGETSTLVSKGISFGTIRRNTDGTWDSSKVVGISALSLKTTGAKDPPPLIIRPFHQAGNVVSLREFTNSAFNHHHGMQSEERFGIGADADGDGFVNELTRADITAATVFQATMPVPGRRISSDPETLEAIIMGEKRFRAIGCTSCHLETLPLDNRGWIYSEPGPYNPKGNIRAGEIPEINIDLTSDELPRPRLKVTNGVVYVPAYTDLKLHDITSGPGDPNREPLDMNQTPGTKAFFAGNGKFITRKLWGIANQHSFGHHGLYTTMREAVLAHAGEASTSAAAFRASSKYDQDCIVEFLKSLQILPLSAKSPCIDENGKDIQCPPDITP
jgi:Di-haem oxidoreductase, putative peroxidase